MQPTLDTTLIYGSAREGRFCDTVARWIAGEIERRGGFSLDILDPAAADVARGIHGEDEIARSALRSRLGDADAFIVITPEYNHSYPAPLKAVIDCFSEEWQAKPVAFVSYGGIAGGLRAVEQLRLVFAELHAVGVRDGVSFPNVWNQFDEGGRPRHPQRASKAVATMLSRLAWWAIALHNARLDNDYREAAL